MSEYLKYTGKKRSIRTTMPRKRNATIMKVARELLIDLSKSQTSTLYAVAHDSDPNISEILIRVMYMFEEKYMMRGWRMRKRLQETVWSNCFQM